VLARTKGRTHSTTAPLEHSEPLPHNRHMSEPVEFRPNQIRLWWLLVAMTMVAVAFALFGPQLQQYPKHLVLAAAFAWTGGAVVWWLLCLWSSSRARRAIERAEPLRIVLRRGRITPRLILAIAMGSFQLSMAGVLTWALLEVHRPSNSIYIEAIPALKWSPLALVPFASCVTLGFSTFSDAFGSWNRCVVLGEQGFASHWRFVRWDRVICHQWHDRDGQIWILLKPSPPPTWIAWFFGAGTPRPIKLRVLPEEREQVERLLAEVSVRYYGAGESAALLARRFAGRPLSTS